MAERFKLPTAEELAAAEAAHAAERQRQAQEEEAQRRAEEERQREALEAQRRAEEEQHQKQAQAATDYERRETHITDAKEVHGEVARRKKAGIEERIAASEELKASEWARTEQLRDLGDQFQEISNYFDQTIAPLIAGKNPDGMSATTRTALAEATRIRDELTTAIQEAA